MKSKMSQFAKSIIVLAVIAVCSGLLIGLIRQFTLIDNAEQQRKIINKLASVYAVSDLTEIDYNSTDGTLQSNIDGFYNAKNSSGEQVYIVISKGIGLNELQMYMVFKDGEIVGLIEGSNTETPSYSEKAFKQDYYSQYLGKKLSEVYPFVLKGEGESGVDAASGATRTSEGIERAVNNGVGYYLEYMNNGGTVIVYLSDVYSIQSLKAIYKSESSNNEFESTDATLNEKMDAMYEGIDADGNKIYVLLARGKGRNSIRYNLPEDLQIYTVLKNNVIVAMKEGTNAETPSYVTKVFDQNFYNRIYLNKNIEQFYRFIADKSLLDKEDADTVTDATRTYEGITEGLNNGIAFYLEYLEGLQ